MAQPTPEHELDQAFRFRDVQLWPVWLEAQFVEYLLWRSSIAGAILCLAYFKLQGSIVCIPLFFMGIGITFLFSIAALELGYTAYLGTKLSLAEFNELRPRFGWPRGFQNRCFCLAQLKARIADYRQSKSR